MTTDIAPYAPGAEDWDSLISSSDEVLGHDLLTGEAADKLVGVPFVITKATFHDGLQRKDVAYRDDYVSCEVVVAPEHIIAQRHSRGRLDVAEISVDPGEHIVFNDGSTGVYRQVVQYLEAKGLIRLPEGPDAGGKGESKFDLPRSQWVDGDEEGTAGFNIRLFAPRGLRVSEYANDFTQDGKTRYIG